MTWDRSQPTDPKYRTKEHREYLASLKRDLQRYGYLECVAVKCLFGSRIITNPNGRAPDGLTAGHNDDGVTYRGPEHRRCNTRDGAVRARAKQVSAGTAAKPWLARDDHACPVCGTTVAWASQRCCSRECANALRGSKPEPEPRWCPICGAQVMGRRRVHCSSKCGAESNARKARDRYRQGAGLPIDPSQPTVPRSTRWTI